LDIYLLEALQHTTARLDQAIERLGILEQAYLDLLPRNEYGLTDYERVMGWRMLQVARGADPQKIAWRFPPESERYQEVPTESVELGTGVQDRYAGER
jgi:hypothetical protein